MCLRLHVVRALLALSGSSALAQTPFYSDTTPFRPDEWATQFGVSSGYASLGVLRFTAPRRAWVLDLRVSGGHTDIESSRTSPDTTVKGFHSNAGVTLRLGRRFYSALRDRVLALYGLGLSGGFVHSASGQDGGTSGETNGWTAGMVFELGGTYFVTRRLSLGAIASASVTYSRSKSRASDGFRSESSTYGGSLGGVSLVATLYF